MTEHWQQPINVATPEPIAPLPFDAAIVYDNFDRRIYRLEQLVTGNMQGRLTYVEGGNFPDGVIIGGDPFDLTPPEDVENVTATPGSFFENIFVDVEWDESATGPDAVSFDVDIAERTAGPTYSILNVFNTGGTNIRINNLKPNFDYGVRVVPVNSLGVRATPPAWVDFSTGADATIPPAPTGLIIGSGASTVVVKFTGLTEAQAPDVAWGHGNYEIEIDVVNTFDSPALRNMISSATVVAFNDIPAVLDPNPPFLPDPSVQLSWYARVRAIDSSGNASAWSATAGPSGPIGGVDGDLLLANLNAAYVTFGSMSGDRIAVNTLDAGRIKTSSITAADITLAGGSFRAQNPVPGSSAGVLINSQGIRLYDTSGAATMVLDAATGQASFTGDITASSITGGTIAGGAITGGTITGTVFRTATTADERLEISGTPAGRIDYYSDSTGEADNGYLYFSVVNGVAANRYLTVRLAPANFEAIGGMPELLLHSRSFDGTTPRRVLLTDHDGDYLFIEDGVAVSLVSEDQLNLLSTAGHILVEANNQLQLEGLDVFVAGSNSASLDGPNIYFNATTGTVRNINSPIVCDNGVLGQYLPIGAINGVMIGAGFPGVDAQAYQLYAQAGSTVVNTDASGYAFVPYGNTFGNGVITVVAVNGDFSAANYAFIAVKSAGTDDFEIEASFHDGSAVASQSIRVNWIAFGW